MKTYFEVSLRLACPLAAPLLRHGLPVLDTDGAGLERGGRGGVVSFVHVFDRLLRKVAKGHVRVIRLHISVQRKYMFKEEENAP